MRIYGEDRMARSYAMVEAEQRQGRQWLEMLNKFDVRFLVLDNKLDRTLVDFFQSRPDWVVDCRDKESVLFVRADSAQPSGRRAEKQSGLVPA
jgi:hypothetical protein